jgi:preprotein translocase subunit YajC
MNAVPSITVSENQLEQWLPYGIIIVLIVIIAFLLISKKRKQQSYPVKEAKRER